MKHFSKLDKILIFMATVFGALILFFPVHKLLFVLLCLMLLVFFTLKPDFLYYFTIITFSIQKHIRFSGLDFFLYEIFVYVCLLVGLYYLLFQNKTASLKTGLDLYIAVLIVVFAIGGFFSVSENGYIEMLQFYEAILFYYITVYYLRTKLIKPVRLVKAIVFIGIAQALFAVFQSFIGDGSVLPQWISSHFGDNRGYLGYIGLGSNFVWHGRGFFTHFIHFGMYLTGILLLFLPLKKFVTPDKKLQNAIILLFVFGIVISYSRSALFALYLGLLYYSWFISINKKKFYTRLITFSAVLIILSLWLSQTSYTETLSPRNDLWGIVSGVICSSPKNLLIGIGFDSFLYTVFPILPPAKQSFYVHPHSFYLEFALNIGIIGLLCILGFLIKSFVQTKLNYKYCFSFDKRLNLSVHLILFSVFIAGIWDRTYVRAAFLIFLLSYLGIVYAKNTELPENKYQNQIS